MNFVCRILLLIALIVVVSIVNEVLSSEHHAYDYWLRTNEQIEMDHCLLSDRIDEEKRSCRLFAIIIDAGSTGTRMHLFEFSYDLHKNALPLRVEKETFKEVKPGLSAFALEPKEAAASVSELLTTAKAAVPKAYWQHTPITLRATAGLRLLPKEQADTILSYVEKQVAKSGFLLGVDGVGIMSGTDEGVFSWITLNVLIDRIKYIVPRKQNDANRERSRKDASVSDRNLAAAALDLGGGSTQVTFIPFDDNKAFAEVDKPKFSHQLSIFGNPIELYTHSYLGNGLVAARLGITQGSSAKLNGRSLMSYCLPADFTINNWDYAGNLWNVTGSSVASFTACLRSAIKYINETDVRRVPELNEHDLYVFSYFYDRGVQGGLIPHTLDNSGGRSTVSSYKEAAIHACSLSSEQIGPEHWQPWQCLDLSYIYALLRYGYGIDDNKQLFLAKRLRNMEMSWALGAAHDLLHRHMKKAIASRIVPTNSSTIKVHSNNSTLVDELLAFISEQTLTVFTYLRLIS